MAKAVFATSAVAKTASQTPIDLNAETLHGQLGEMGNFLGRKFDTGEAIPEQVTPAQLLNLKRGLSKEFLGRWNPETHADTIGTGRSAYNALNQELNRTVPQAAGLNERISNLIPVVRRAESNSRNGGILQQIMGRVKAPTGALLTSAAGASAGAATHGVPGALFGGAAGLISPAIFASPTTQMAIARGLNIAPKLVPAATGTALQFTRKNP
jgi:hypothetical protein